MPNLFISTEQAKLLSDQNERILARRYRVQRRLESFSSKKSTSCTVFNSISTVSNTVKEEPKLKLNFSLKQVETSMHILDKLIRDGIQLTTNVEKAVDARELEWRAKQKAVVEERTARLELENKAGQERFLEVESAWEALFKHNVSHTLYKKLTEQKQACSALVSEKNDLIDHLKKELAEKENAFIDNISKQADDVKIVIERMNEHARLMKRAYQGEIEAMELAFMQERRDILKAHQQKFNDTLKNMNTKEDSYVETRRLLIDECQEELDKQWKEDVQEYNTLKSKMETDIMKLELEYRTLKTKVMMNQEKLEYNYHTLKKRDEENSVMKSNQKRRLTKMNDTMANLKRKLRELEKQCSNETQKLSEDYKKIVNQLLLLEKKYTLFQKIDIGKYRDVWKMNELELKTIVIRLLKLDKIIHEQYLAIPWIDIDINFMHNIGPWGKVVLHPQLYKPQKLVKPNINKYEITGGLLAAKKLATDDSVTDITAEPTVPSLLEVSDSTTAESVHTSHPQSTMASIFATHDGRRSYVKKSVTSSHQMFSRSVLRRIMMLLCDHAGFLVEDRVLRIVNDLPKTEKNLIQASSIFNALSIYSEDEMLLLSQYFARYSVSDDYGKPVEGGPQRTAQESSQKEQSKPVIERHMKKSVRRKSTTMRTGTIYADQLSANDFLRAIREFVSEHRKVSTVVEKVPTLFCQQLIRNQENDEKYWSFYFEVIPQDHIRLWKSLIPALEKYHNMLIQREKLQANVKCLRVQNNELQNILDRYLRAKINHELKLPPIPVRIVTPHQSILQLEETVKSDSPKCVSLPQLVPCKVDLPALEPQRPNERENGNQYLNL